MNIQLEYTGTIGSGTICLDISDEATVKDMLTAFHQAIDKDDFYTIQGGAPPNRRAMKVRYEYFINTKRLKTLDTQMADLGISLSDTVTLHIDKGMRVD